MPNTGLGDKILVDTWTDPVYISLLMYIYFNAIEMI